MLERFQLYDQFIHGTHGFQAISGLILLVFCILYNIIHGNYI